MLVTGIILVPTAIATPAVKDLVDLRNVINAAASAIGDPNNPNRGFSLNLLGGSSGMGTADLVNNITTTILRGKFQLDTNRTSWLLPDNIANTSIPINGTAPPSLATPTLPLTASLALPSSLPSTTPVLNNLTIDLTSPYLDYVSSLPNLASSLTTLGRAFHREMNAPVSEAISGLQQSLNTFQTSLLASELITAQAVLRTIRGSSSLETAQEAWGRFLNLPGGSGGDEDAAADPGATAPVARGLFGRTALKMPPPKDGKFYTHQELWNRSEVKAETPAQEGVVVDEEKRSEPRARQSTVGKLNPHDAVVQMEEQRATTAENARVGRPFVV